MSTNTINAFISRSTASPYAVVLGLALGNASYFFWGGLALQSMGAMAIPTHPKARNDLGIDIAKSVEIWSWAYKLGAKHMGISGVVAGLSILTAAFSIPQGTPISRKSLLLLSAATLSSGVYTVIFMLPTNKSLLAIRDKLARRKLESSGEVALTAMEEQEAITLLEKWQQMHYVRIILGGLSWFGAMAAYVTTV